MAAGARARRDAHERLVNLVVSLQAANAPRTFAQLRDDTRDYDQPDDEAARRMFERDKRTLRDIGVQIETVEVDGHHAYRLAEGAMGTHPVQLDREESTALAIALDVAGGRRERLALSKLTVRSPDPDPAAPAPSLRVERVDPGVGQLAAVVADGGTVAFDYRRADGEVATRTVDTWGVVLHRFAAYLVGWDHDRRARRTFRVSRMVSRPRIVDAGPPTPPPEGFDLTTIFDRPVGDPIDVELVVHTAALTDAVRRGGVVADEAAREGADGSLWRRVVLPDTDPHRLRTWLLRDADRVVVRAPGWLADSITSELRAVAHQGAA